MFLLKQKKNFRNNESIMEVMKMEISRQMFFLFPVKMNKFIQRYYFKGKGYRCR